jgi:hypothetical protein
LTTLALSGTSFTNRQAVLRIDAPLKRHRPRPRRSLKQRADIIVVVSFSAFNVV